jgi:hypothetical protein
MSIFNGRVIEIVFVGVAFGAEHGIEFRLGLGHIGIIGIETQA